MMFFLVRSLIWVEIQFFDIFGAAVLLKSKLCQHKGFLSLILWWTLYCFIQNSQFPCSLCLPHLELIILLCTELTSVTVRISWARLRRSSPRECPTCWRETKTGFLRSTPRWPSPPSLCTTRQCSQSWSHVRREYSRANRGRTETWVITYISVVSVISWPFFYGFCWKIVNLWIQLHSILVTIMLLNVLTDTFV